MGRGIIVGGALVLILGCALTFAIGRGIWQSVSKHIIQTPAQVEAVAQSIADFDLPAGYSTDYAVEFLGFSLAAYKPGDGHSHIMLLQAPSGLHIDQSELEQQLGTGQQHDDQLRLTVVSQEHRTVRGQEASLVISEGISSDGTPIRQYNMVFEGKQGTSLLAITEPLARWDPAIVETFIASIH